METHSSVIAKRMWNVLRIAFFMMRKGFISKRKMIMDMNLMMKKGKVLRKSLSNLMSSSQNRHRNKIGGGFMVHDYEFSCSNSPTPGYFNLSKRKHHFNFPCINAPEVIEDETLPCYQLSSPLEFGIENVCKDSVAIVPKTPEYTFNFRFDSSEERKSPRFSVRVSNYSALGENEEIGNCQVDDEAEDFIRKFYEQLRTQSPVQLPGF